jgi:hypothetical protein
MNKLKTMLQAGRIFGMRDGILRLQYELQRGSGVLNRRMRSVEGWDFWTLDRIAPGISAKEMRASRRNGVPRFFFHDARSLGPSIKKIIGPDEERAVIAEAEQILRGELPFFGGLFYDCGFPPRWFRNPVTGQSVSPQQLWTQMRFASPSYGDLKFILEPSRFLFVYSLARAYALSAEERFPEAFWRIVEDWASQSPPMSGPLWICGQECSLRILAWSFGLHAFIHSPSTTSERVALLTSMIAAHAWRTAQTLGYARSQRSNHLITEAAGLWTAGVLYPELQQATVWRDAGSSVLLEAVLDHITPEGVSQQHSFNYQRMILHLLLWTLRLADIHSTPLPSQIQDRALSAFDFMNGFVDPLSGSAPNYGSDDGSLIFPLASARYHDFRSLLQLGAAVLNRPPLNAGPWDESSLWFGIQAAAVPELAAATTVDTGYFRLGNEKSWALIRAGRYTRRPFQADQLHVDLWWHGLNLARDAGTYLYNGPPPWNNGFAGTSVHNTVMVDHQDQMRRAGRFLWIDWAQGSGKISKSSDGICPDRFAGEHDGYRGIDVTHRRAVQWLGESGWIIVDDVTGRGEYDVRLHWLVADFPFEVGESPFQITFKSQQERMCWSIHSSVMASVAMVRAGKQITASPRMNNGPKSAIANSELLGWEAATYGDLRPAVSLVQQAHSQLPVRFVTVVLTGERCRLEEQSGEVVILCDDPTSSTEYRVSLSDRKLQTPESFPVTQKRK